jgi:hypothetical protein
VRLKGGWKPSPTAEHEESVGTQESGSWAPALTVLDALLADSKWRRARVRLVVSDHWARYAVVPWSVELRSPEERLAHARQILASLYGEIVSDWDVCVSEARPLCTRVACALPAGLSADLRTLCNKHALRLSSLQPQLIASYESWRHRLPGTCAWFVTVEQGSLAAARIGDGGWDRVHSVRIGNEWARELKRLQTFGRIASSSPEEGQVYVDAPQPWQEVAGLAGKDLHWLQEEGRLTSTLQHLGRLRRLAA